MLQVKLSVAVIARHGTEGGRMEWPGRCPSKTFRDEVWWYMVDVVDVLILVKCLFCM